GYMQHVLFDANREVVTNASTCSSGVTADPHRIMNVHNSKLDSSYSSTLVLFNVGGIGNSMNFAVRDPASGSIVARFFGGNVPFTQTSPSYSYPMGQVTLNAPVMESYLYAPTDYTKRITLTPTSVHFNLTDEFSISFPGNIYKVYYQHL